MNHEIASVFGIGNPLIDVVLQASDADLAALALDKGIMHLVDADRQAHILQHFAGKEPTFRPGGAAPNTLIALAGLGIPATICGKIGSDEFGSTYNQQVSAYGINSRLAAGSGPTGSSVILVTPDGERTMNTHLGMSQEFGATDVDEDLLRQSDYLYFTGYMWDTEVQKAAIRRALEVAHANDVTVAFDVADPFAVGRYRDDFLVLLREDVDIVFANRAECEILFADGNTDVTMKPETLAERLGASVRIAALKVGKDGSLVSGTSVGGSVQAVTGRPIVATDTTGAGDMFAAGFLAALCQGRDPIQAARAAGWLAEEIIQHVGAQFSSDVIAELRTEIAAFLDE